LKIHDHMRRLGTKTAVFTARLLSIKADSSFSYGPRVCHPTPV
jgi:hypothetical protein